MTARAAADPNQRVLGGGGRAPGMLAIMAIMLFLTVLAAALGLGLTSAAHALERQLAGRLTVQVVEPDAARRETVTRTLVARLAADPHVTRAQAVDRVTLLRLLRPWLGEDAADPALPIPALIDVDLAGDTDRGAAAIAAIARRVSPRAEVDRHARWMSPVSGLMTGVIWLAAAVVAMMAAATGAVVVLAARAGLDMHRDTIEVLHMLGSTDVQVARLFQRRIALDTLAGGAIGTAAALAVIVVLGGRIADTQSQLLAGIALTPGAWIALALLPLIFTALATGAARGAVLRQLARKL